METSMKRLTKALATLAGASWLLTAQAQNEPTYDQVDLNASASQDVENDLLIAFVFAEVEANDQADAADAVNEAIAWAAGRARRIDGIEVQTTNYNTRPVYANGRRIVGWVARQSLRLESTESQALSELLGELQQRVAVQSINYGLSDAARDAAEEALIAEALAQFKRRAKLIADELGRDGYKIVRLSIGNNGTIFASASRARMAFAEADVAQPEIEAGTQPLSVNVTGTIELAAAP
jgi:predicted secreted protein